MNIRHSWAISFATLALLAADVQVAHAESWPAHRVSIVVPYAPGGNTDFIARIAAQSLTKALGQPFIVENKGGAGGTIAAEYVARAKPDGYTLFMGTITQISLVRFTNKIRYDPIKDFVPIVNVGGNPYVIAVNAERPFKTLDQLIKYGRANPGVLNVGHAGVGGLTHLSAVLFLHKAGIKATLVSYKGGAPALNGVLSGSVDMYSGNVSEVLPYANGKQLNLLAVSSPERLKQLPNVPTLADTYPGYDVETWNGLLAPAGTPPEIVDKIADAMTKALKTPEVKAQLFHAGITPIYEAKQVFAQRIQSDIVKWKPIIEAAGIKPQ